MRANKMRWGHRRGHFGGLAGLVGLELLAVAALHRLGRLPGLAIDWRHLPLWLTSSGVEEVLAASLRLVAMACAYWVLVTTILYVAARLTRLPAAIRAVEWATLPAMRRVADRALAVALVGSTVTGGAGISWASAVAPCEAPLVVLGASELPRPPGVQPPPPPPLEGPCSISSDDRNGLDLPAATTPPSEVAPPPDLAPPDTPSLVIPPSVQPSHEARDGAAGGHGAPGKSPNGRAEAGGRHVEEVHVVVRGDNLWRIAASTLRRGHGPELADREIAAYWHMVMRANRGRLRSGDPDLIFPGERVLLPRRGGPAAGSAER